MRAMVMTAPGGPEVLQLRSVAMPEIRRPSQLRVRLKAAGINPIDTKLRQRGTFYPDRMPAILGCDGAGIVEAVGDRVGRFEPGDRVWFCNGGLGAEPGTYAEYAVVEEGYCAPMPRSLDFTQAAAVPLALITAWESLHDRGRIARDQQVLIHGGAGGVGHLAIQLAIAAGARVATTVSSPEKARFVGNLGAEAAILYREGDFVQAVLDWTRGRGVDLAFDTVGGPLLEQTFPAVKVYGDLVTILAPDPATNWKLARDRNLRLSLELMLTPQLQGLEEARHHQARILEQAAQAFDRGTLRVEVAQVYPLEAAAHAHARLEAGGLQGKLVLAIA